MEPSYKFDCADLHLHSHFSDGTFAPWEIAERARAAGIGTLSLTDHDTLEGCELMAEACAARGIRFVSGTELTVEHRGQEMHLLGYFVDPAAPRLRSEIARFQVVRQNRIREMVERINAKGLRLEVDAVLRLANCQSPGRPHLARALVLAGHCATFDEAFERFLKKGRPGWVPKAKMTLEDAVVLIHEAGGAAVLAHPGLYRSDSVIPELAAMGLDGLECWHSKHVDSATRGYLELARSLGLVATGGSDCHGMTKDRPLIGTIRVPAEQVDRLAERCGNRGKVPAASVESGAAGGAI